MKYIFLFIQGAQFLSVYKHLNLKQKTFYQKLGTFFVVIVLVGAGLFLFILSGPQVAMVPAASTWTQTSDIDFFNGTSDNITIIGSGDAAKLQIDLSKDYHWRKVTPANAPNEDTAFSMATICNDDKAILFGGLFSDQTWEYDLSANSWVDKTPEPRTPNYPSGRWFPALASIYGDDKAILFGGSYGPSYLEDTWEYDSSASSWFNKTKTTRPSGRYKSAMAAIYGTDKVLLFGGDKGFSTSNFLNDTWVYDASDAAWTDKTPSSIPTNYPIGRIDHAMAAIYGTDKVLLFGGIMDTYNKYFNDTWIYDFSEDNWTRMITVGPSPGPTARHGMASIHGDDKVVLFGGGSRFAWLNDTWVYDLSDNVWTKVILRDPSIQPGVRTWYGLAPIDGQDKIILFGGTSAMGYSNDTWIYSHFLPLRNGTYISKPFDTGSKSEFNSISWYANILENTTIKFQLRTAADETSLLDQLFVGKNGTETSFYSSSSTDIWSGHNGDRWVQYKAYFNISILKDSPSLREITISYNCIPSTIVVDPINNSLITTNNPTFKWTFEDMDSTKQKAFQVLIDDDINFENVTFDSDEQLSDEEFWEFPMGTSFIDLPDGVWYWKARTKDEDDVWSEFSTPLTLIIDSQTPGSAPLTPKNNEFYYNVSSISGIAADPNNGSGLNKVEITIKNLRDNTYWNGTTWVPFQRWLSASGRTNWEYDSSNIDWTSGNKYSVQSRAIDIATNIEQPTVVNLFTIDRDKPKSIIEYPSDNNWLNELELISGSSLDIISSEIEKVEISIQCSHDFMRWDSGAKENEYWDGTGWTSKRVWHPATGTMQWMYDSSQLLWTTGNHYIIRSRATDKVGNIETPGPGITFMYDAKPPENVRININDNDNFTDSTSVILSLQAEDIGSGLSQMSFSSDNSIWSEWQIFNTSRSFELPIGDGEKTIYFRVRDVVGNVAEPVANTITLDTTPPEDLSIVINDDEKFTNSKQVKIDLQAIDKFSGVNKISLSYDGAHWQTWGPYIMEMTFTLPPVEGENRIFFKAKDKVGNIAEPVFDTIILDTLPPFSLSILINNGLSVTNSTSVTLTLHAIDNTSGIDKISFSTDSKSWSAWEEYQNTGTYFLSAGNGLKTIYFKAKDSAGNEAVPVSDSIILKTTPIEDDSSPEKDSSGLNIWLISLIIAIILFTIIIAWLVLIINRKKRSYQKLLTSGALTIRPGTLLGGIATAEQIPKPVERPQLPTVAEIGTPGTSISGSPTPVPTLAKSTQGDISTPQTSGQPPTQDQQSLPALPPAESPKDGPEVSPVTTITELTSDTSPEPTTQLPNSNPEQHQVVQKND